MSAQFRILQLIQTAVVSFQPLLDWDSQSNIETSDVLRYPGSVYMLCVEGIPFTRMFEKISGMYNLIVGGATTAFSD